MGYIKKLKSNELVGGTDKTTIYPVTSTEAVFEEITNGNESSFKSQKTINGEHDNRIKGLENEMPDTVKSITINGGTKTYLPEDGNVELTIYSPGGEDYPGIAEMVQENKENIKAVQDTIDNLNTELVSTDPHVRVSINQNEGLINNLNATTIDVASASALDNLSEYVESIYQTKIIVVEEKPDTGEAGIIYRIPNVDGTTYTDWMYNEDNTEWIEMATFNISTVKASDISYVDSNNVTGAENVQEALDEIAGKEILNIAYGSTEDGFYLIDHARNVGLRYNNDGLDAGKVNSHFASVLKNVGVDVGNIADVAETGLFVCDGSLNIGFLVDAEGVHAPNMVAFETIEY